MNTIVTTELIIQVKICSEGGVYSKTKEMTLPDAKQIEIIITITRKDF